MARRPRKMAARAPAMQAKGYSEAGASHRKTTMKNFNPHSGSAREDINDNLNTLRQRCRSLYMASPVASSAIKNMRTNVIGQGLKLQSEIDRDVLGLTEEQAQEWQKQTEREFALWASDKRACDAIGQNDFYGLQQLAFTSWMLSGDCFALLKHAKPSRLQPYSLRIHLLEADRISTPWNIGGAVSTVTTVKTASGNYIFDGIEVDSNGLPVAYHICNQHPEEYGLSEPKQWTRVPAIQARTGLPNVLHVMESERPDQYRGVPYLAPVLEILLQERKYTEYEVNAAQLESALSGFITTSTDTTEIPFNTTNDLDQEMDLGKDDVAVNPGTYIHLEDGEAVTNLTPSRPASGFGTFTDAINLQVGAGLEQPKDILMKSYNSSYSASRAAQLDFGKTCRMKRAQFAADYCNPAYEAFLSEAIARGRISAPGFFSDPAIRAAYLKCEWIGPAQGQLDPVKEVTAEILKCSEGFSTHKASTTALGGGDWSSNMAELKIETGKIAEAGGSPDPHQGGTSGNDQPEESGEQEERQNPDSHLDKTLQVLKLLDSLDRKEERDE